VNQNLLVHVHHVATTTLAKVAAWLPNFSLGYHSMAQTQNALLGMAQNSLQYAKRAQFP
jgi:hypothetical protein